MLPIFGSRAGGRKLYYTADLPSFQRDFASLKTLDHGTGPNITFTRGSNATYFDADGVLQTASTNVPRFDHSTDGLATSLGLLIEEARTNSIRNSQAGGSTNGVIGSGGALPTNWQNGGGLTSNGISLEVVGSGSESGLSYIDFKITGTPTASAAGSIRFETTNVVAATNVQSWTLSHFVKLQSGSLSNAAVSTAVQGYDNTNNFISGQQTSINITPTSSDLRTQRRSVSHTYSNASVAFAFAFVSVTYTSGNPIDLTLRIAAPQLEQGAFPTSYIPTTSAAATRAADSAVVTPISSFYNGTEGTIYNEFAPLTLDGTSAVRGVVAFAELSGWLNRLLVGYRGTGAQFFTAVANNVNEFNVSGTAGLIAANTTARAIQAYQTNNSARALNGASAVAVSGAITDPTRERMLLGQSDAPNFLNGHIRKVAYWPKRLTNTLLQQLTT